MGSSEGTREKRVVWVDKTFDHLTEFIKYLKNGQPNLVVSTFTTNEDAFAAVSKFGMSKVQFVITNMERSTPRDGFLLLEKLKSLSYTGKTIVYSLIVRNTPTLALECVKAGAYVACNLPDIERLVCYRNNDVPIKKLHDNLCQLPQPPQTKLGVFILSGSFNPIHAVHVAVFETAKLKLERDHGFSIIGGFVAPSSDSYVSGKLGPEAIALQHRNLLSRLAVLNSPWIDVLPWGLASSHMVANATEKILARYYPHLNIEVLELCGADHAAKFSIWKYNSPMVCIGRSPDTEIVAQGLKRDLHHPDFILIEEEPGVVSSTAIRNYVQQKNWEKLLTLGWVEEKVVQYLEALDKEVYISVEETLM